MRAAVDAIKEMQEAQRTAGTEPKNLEWDYGAGIIWIGAQRVVERKSGILTYNDTILTAAGLDPDAVAAKARELAQAPR